MNLCNDGNNKITKLFEDINIELSGFSHNVKSEPEFELESEPEFEPESSFPDSMTERTKMRKQKKI